MLALALMVAGTGLGGVIVGKWAANGLGGLAEERLAILAATLLIVASFSSRSAARRGSRRAR